MSSNITHRWVVDACEEGMASLEVDDGNMMITVPHSLLPPDAKHGDILRVTIEIDEAATKQAMSESAAQVKKGREKSAERDRGGDLKL
jgi:hypothetical protein